MIIPGCSQISKMSGQPAKENLERAQKRQKKEHDKKACMPIFAEGDWAFVFKPAAEFCKAYKFTRPYHGQDC